jgi:hypothetical protein
MPQTGLLLCTRCKKILPESLFKKSRARGKWCEGCYLQYYKDYNASRTEKREDRSSYLDDRKSQRAANKAALVAYMGGACSICGYNKSVAALDFDHLTDDGNPFPSRGSKNENKQALVSKLLAATSVESFDAAVEEAKKCVLVCANCHRERTFPDSVSPVGAETLEEARARLAARREKVKEDLSRQEVTLRKSSAAKTSSRVKKLAERSSIAVEARNGEDVRRYASISETAKDGFNPTSVSRCVNGWLNSHKGFKWRIV